MRRTILPGLLLLGMTACGSSERAGPDQDPSDERLRSSRGYKYALQAADESEAVHGVLGTPMHAGTVKGSSESDLTIRVFGPAGAGTLHVHESDVRDSGEKGIRVCFVADSGKEIALPTSNVH